MLKFELSTEQELQVLKWRNTHKCKLRNKAKGKAGEIYVGAIGGALTYNFTPTGLGIAEGVKCTCGEKLDITDYDLW